MVEIYDPSELELLTTVDKRTVEYPMRRKANYAQRLELGCLLQGLTSEELIIDSVFEVEE